jgi:subtilisin family serine protease
MRWRVISFLLCGLAAPALCVGGPFIPNDPRISQSWHIEKLGLPETWGYSLGNSSIIAAVLDTGVMSNTADLQGRLLPAVAPAGTAILDGSGVHHGTWVSSILAMGVNDGIGGVGVGNFSILPVTVTNSNGNNSSDVVADGIRLAADSGARVINISLSTLSYGKLDAAAAYAKERGALVFVAAGNTDARIERPDYENLIFVSGTNRQDGRWDADGDVAIVTNNSGSSWGPFVDLSAPAEDILLADPTFASGYGIGDGTSFAAPLAAGAAALAWSINPSLSPDEVKSILFSTAVDLGESGWDEVYGFGRIDVGAVAAAAAVSVPDPRWINALFIPGLIMVRKRRRFGAAACVPQC